MYFSLLFTGRSDAKAALVGKQAIVGNLKSQLSKAQDQLHAEIAQYQQNQNAAKAAEEAQAQVNSLAAALATAQGGSQHASRHLKRQRSCSSTRMSLKPSNAESDHRPAAVCSEGFAGHQSVC
ncbi:hypothetical protein JTB14_021435 [Gonioctena quinquepunctata]|nr:hypothetical protein JTB14_021435 [Gonioctena quinquepunctata]